MDKRGSLPEIDPLLRPFLLSRDDQEREQHLAGLITNHASPIIKEAVWLKLRALSHCTADGVQHQEAEDIHNEAILHLVARLRDIQSNPDSSAINNFRSYVAVVSYNACNEHLRRKYPLRHSLKNRLRYVLTHQPRMSLWMDDKGLMCGYSAWQAGVVSQAVNERLSRLRNEPSHLEKAQLLESAERVNLTRVTTVTLDFLGGPVEFDDLVGIVAEIAGIKDTPAEASRDGADNDEDTLVERTADSRPSFSTAVEERLSLTALWKEIRELPLRQKMALLLNLKDDRGNSQIEMFPLTGVATIREIADTLEMRDDEFARLWNELPIEDALIAKRMNLTRQQIINLRKAARQRLGKRMREAIL